MMKTIFSFLLVMFCGAMFASAQVVPTNVLLKIVKAEDERRFDADLSNLLTSPNAKIRQRAALASGRIGDDKAVALLLELLQRDLNADVRASSAFALGEIESIRAVDVLLQSVNGEQAARVVEAMGKIAAANPKNDKSTKLGQAILEFLNKNATSSQSENESDNLKPETRNLKRASILLGITAALRAKPPNTDVVIADFLTAKDARIRADALNALARLKAKNPNYTNQARALLSNDKDAIVRANAARVLAANEDVASVDLLIKTATTDEDQRTRVAAIRALGSLKDKRAASLLLTRGESLSVIFKNAKIANSSEKNELLEIAAALGQILLATNDERAIKFIREFYPIRQIRSPETAIAFARIAPEKFVDELRFYEAQKVDTSIGLLIYAKGNNALPLAGVAQGFGEIANSNNAAAKAKAQQSLHVILEKFVLEDREAPEVIRAYANFKSDDLPKTLEILLQQKDVIVRAAAAELLGELPASKENVEALQIAFAQALKNDKDLNDAQLAILAALVKLDKAAATDSLKLALDAPDYLVRRTAAELIAANDLTKDFPDARAKVGIVTRYKSANGTKLGQTLDADADYLRAISRRNGNIKAIITTGKGAFTIDLLPEDAPLTVDNFVKLARAGKFDNTAFHRVVPNFVAQGGDFTRADGNGGPGYSIRDEINTVEYERGAVGMALSGKDTGGSQWFVTHSPQPHLDGGYTVFGKVDDAGMRIVDRIARGDKILSVRIVEKAWKK